MRNWIHENEVNEAMNCKKSIKNQIVPGMGATMFVGSDRYAMVVREIKSPKCIMVSHVIDAHEDKFVYDEERGVDILPNEYFEQYEKFGSYYKPIEYTLRKNGRWMPKGYGMWETSSIHIGHAENYMDPSF